MHFSPWACDKLLTYCVIFRLINIVFNCFKKLKGLWGNIYVCFLQELTLKTLEKHINHIDIKKRIISPILLTSLLSTGAANDETPCSGGASVATVNDRVVESVCDSLSLLGFSWSDLNWWPSSLRSWLTASKLCADTTIVRLCFDPPRTTNTFMNKAKPVFQYRNVCGISRWVFFINRLEQLWCIFLLTRPGFLSCGSSVRWYMSCPVKIHSFCFTMLPLALAQLTAEYHLGHLSIKIWHSGAAVCHVASQQEILVSYVLAAPVSSNRWKTCRLNTRYRVGW